MDGYEKAFLVLMTLGIFVVGTLVGRFGRVGTWRSGLVLGITGAVATTVAGWRQHKD